MKYEVEAKLAWEQNRHQAHFSREKPAIRAAYRPPLPDLLPVNEDHMSVKDTFRVFSYEPEYRSENGETFRRIICDGKLPVTDWKRY